MSNKQSQQAGKAPLMLSAARCVMKTRVMLGGMATKQPVPACFPIYLPSTLPFEREHPTRTLFKDR